MGVAAAATALHRPASFSMLGRDRIARFHSAYTIRSFAQNFTTCQARTYRNTAGCINSTTAAVLDK